MCTISTAATKNAKRSTLVSVVPFLDKQNTEHKVVNVVLKMAPLVRKQE